MANKPIIDWDKYLEGIRDLERASNVLQAENARLKKGIEIAKGIIRTPFKRHNVKTSLAKIDQALKEGE